MQNMQNMQKPVVFMFSGQGSQYFHMGKELYETHPRFQLWMDHCDEMVEPLIGESLMDIVYKQVDKTQAFDNILHTNPALLSIEFSLARMLMEMGLQPDYLMGYSLGEFTAAVVSGAIELEDALTFLVDYARLLQADSPYSGMLAIIEAEQIVQQEPELFANCWVTARNFDKNFVVSGLDEDIRRVHQTLLERKVICQRLPVNYGFHTEIMDPLKDRFKEMIAQTYPGTVNIPTFSCFTQSLINEVTADYFWDVIRYPIEFSNTVSQMLKTGDFMFVDVGPSGSLATFVKYLLPASSESTYVEVINQFGKNINSLEKMRDQLQLT